jgi:hypothetical protein
VQRAESLDGLDLNYQGYLITQAWSAFQSSPVLVQCFGEVSMKYFLDTEFIEDGKTIDLISIGIVCEDGREFYAINEECHWYRANDWVLGNVLIPMGIGRYGWLESDVQMMSPRIRENYMRSMSRLRICEELLRYFGSAVTNDEGDGFWDASVKDIEFWADYASYDWVVFCQIFGTMMDLPKEFPMRCNDLQQWRDQMGGPDLPPQTTGMHNALEDARWNKLAWEFLNSLSTS